MELFDDIADDGGLEPHPLSDDDLQSEDDNDDDDDDDDDDFDKTDIAHDSIDIKKPLAGMLPNTYEGKTAEELFPAFKPNAILQFNKIFGVGKSNHLPKLWTNLRRPSVKENISHEIREATATECAVDNETQFLGRLPPVIDEPISDGQEASITDMKIANWRVGPARLWYDQIGLSLDLPKYDYGFKLKQSQTLQTQVSKDSTTEDNELTGNASLPVNLTRWEDEIIYDTAVLRDRLDLNSPKIRYCGWVPTTSYRSLASFQKNIFGKNVDYLENTNDDDAKYKTWYSIFPIDNYDLMYGDWEKDIIIDPENMERIREPPELILDENDDHLIFEIPTDPNDCQSRQQRATRDAREKVDANTTVSPTKTGKGPQRDTRGRVTRTVLRGSGILKETMDNDDDGNDQTDSPKNDFWNLSNDEYYNPRLVDSVGKNLGSLNLQHATPAVELCTQLFPTHLNATKLRHFHRPTIKKVQHGKLKPGEYHPVQSVQRISENRAIEREKERQAYGGGEMFYMRRLQDLSGLDSDIVLAEYCEQYPPLVNQIGMATRIKNYYKKKPGKQDNPPMLDYGEISYAHTSPFQADMLPGEILQAFENHMFRAPIFRHDLLPTDFLVLRTKSNYHIRNIKNIFTIGQQCPLQEVPGPNSKRANIFARDFLQAYIFRLFWKSRDKPPRIKMEDVRKAFPQNAENSIRKRLKMSSDFKRTGGVHCNWWVLRNDFRLPTQEEIRQLVTPEQCCAYYSMQAAEQRLKDAGYGEKVLFAAVDEEGADENDTSKIEDEVKCAPWHTTKAYLDSLKGKCWLQLRGFADPTGSGEGFSYVRVSNKPNARQEAETEAIQTKKMVTGTDADLRRLHLKEAKKILNKFGVSDNHVRNLSRWQIIDIVRTMSTARARDGEDGAAMAKFARGNRYSQLEYQEKYKEDCRKIFEVQNKSLASNHLTSTDNETSGEEDSDVDEMRKNLESMLEPTDSKQSHETKPHIDTSDAAKKTGSRVLKIIRTYSDDDGREYQRIEYVRKPMVVEAYSKIRTTKDNDFIRQFFTIDEDQRENLRRERRRLQEQLRRVRRQDRLQQRNTTVSTNNTTMDQHSPSSRSSNPSPVRNGLYLRLNNSDIPSIKISNDPNSFIKNDINTMDENHLDSFMDNHHNMASASQLMSTSIDNLNSNSHSGFAHYFSSASIGDEGHDQHEMISPVALPTTNADGSATLKRRKKSDKDLKSLKCGACGAQGHMRTNRVCPMYGKTTGGNVQTNIAVDSEDAQHSFDLQQHDSNIQVNVGDVSVKMVEPGGTKLIFAKNVLEKASSKDSSRKSKKPKGSKLSTMSIGGIESTGDGDESTANSQLMSMDFDMNSDRPPTPPPIVHVSKMPFIPPIKSSTSSASVNLTYTPQSSGTLKTTLSHTGSRRKSSTTPTNTGIQLKHSQSYVSSSTTTGRQQPTSTPLSSGPLGTMFSFPPNTPTTPTPSSAGVDYLDKRARTIQRRRIDPLVSFASLLESILNELRDMPEANMFLTPVNSRSYPAYYEVIKNPMDLQKIRQRVLAHTYETREGFLNDVRQLVENSRQFNGESDQITRDAQTIFAACFQKFAANEDKLMKLEKAINPLLDDDLLVAISYLFERILSEHLMNVENSWPFHHAVNKVRFKDYYDIVKTPMDLEKIKNNILKHTYRSRAAMLADVNLLYTNSVQYNGELHSITAIASKIVQTCKEQFEEHAEQFGVLERNLEQQSLSFSHTLDQQVNEDDWQQMMSSESTNPFNFNQLMEEQEEANVTSPGMSLETFISREVSTMAHNLQAMEAEQNEDNDDEPYQTTEKITTEDILGNISESDTSDDDNDTRQSSSIFSPKIQQDLSNEANLTTNESSSKHRHHKHSKKRLKTSHATTTSTTDAAALQLSEDEL